jgi:SH3-like domain-containing protein
MRQILSLGSIAVVALLVGLAATLGPAGAAGPDDKAGPQPPRFVSMKHGENNVRVGPGLRYQISWVFKRRDMPVELIGSFESWRQIRDWEGTEGWVNQTALSDKRTIIVKGEIRALRRLPDKAAEPVAQIEPGVVGHLLECPADKLDWCRVEVEDTRGWLRRAEFWGVYPAEIYPQ